MGFFSWTCSVSGDSIRNKHSDQGATPCVLITPDDEVITEYDYEGYGEFGGKDVYGLFASWHGLEPDRGLGVDLQFGDQELIKFPIKIVSKKYYIGQKYNELVASKDCASQGFFNWE